MRISVPELGRLSGIVKDLQIDQPPEELESMAQELEDYANLIRDLIDDWKEDPD